MVIFFDAEKTAFKNEYIMLLLCKKSIYSYLQPNCTNLFAAVDRP
jgi:hypothetical protein